MAGQIGHRRAPEVVLEDVTQRINGQHVLVERHRGDVIVHEVPIQPVHVAGYGHRTHQAVQRPGAGGLPQRRRRLPLADLGGSPPHPGLYRESRRFIKGSGRLFGVGTGTLVHFTSRSVSLP